MKMQQSLLAVTAVIVIASSACGASRTKEVVLAPTQTPSSSEQTLPADTPTAETSAAETPTADTPATATPVSFAAWWSTQMTQDADGKWWPPAEVEQMVKDHYLQADEAVNAPLKLAPPDYKAFEEAVDAWQCGPSRKGSLEALATYREHTETISYGEWGETSIQTYDWNRTGLECRVRFAGNDCRIYEHDSATGDLIKVTEMAEGLLMSIQMRYDPQNGHWKVCDVLLSLPYGGRNIEIAERIIGEFVKALHEGDMESAYRLFAEEARAQQSPEEFAAAVQTGVFGTAIENYQSLEVCEAMVLSEGQDRVLEAVGLLHYEGGDTFFISDLHQDSNQVLHILSFRIEPSVEPKPWGDCQQS